MRIYSANDDINVELYEERLNMTSEIYMDLSELGIYAEQQAIKAATLTRLCLQYMNLHSQKGYTSISVNSVLHYLQYVEKVPKSLFKSKGVASESLNMKKVLLPMRENKYAVDFLDIYIKRQECNSRSNNMTAFYNRSERNKKVRGWEGMLTAIPFLAQKNINLRFNYSNENIISFPKEISAMIKAPEGYVLAWGDFAQSDARIAYNTLLKDEENYKYISVFPDDIYAGFANWVSCFTYNDLLYKLKIAENKFYEKKRKILEEKLEDNFFVKKAKEDVDKYAATFRTVLEGNMEETSQTKNIILKYESKLKYLHSMEEFVESEKEKFRSLSVNDDSEVKKLKKQIKSFVPFSGFKNKNERDLYKVYVLQTIYGTRRHLVPYANKFINILGKVLESCSKYKKYWDDIQKRASYGIPIRVRSYMGHVEYVPAFDGDRVKETLYKCLNYPVQGCTSELIISTTNQLLDTFYNLGYTEDDIRVYYNRHDEPVFILKESVMKDSWIFKDFSKIQMDDWIPLCMDFSFGRNYSEEDKDLMEKYELSIRINKNKIKADCGTLKHVEYYPLDKLLELAMHIEVVFEKKVLIVLYSEEKNSFDTILLEVSNTQNLGEIMMYYINRYIKTFYDLGYRQVVILNKVLHDDDMSGNIPVTRLYRISSSISVFRSYVIAMAAKSTLLKTTSQLVEDNHEFLNSVSRLNMFGGISNVTS